MLITQDEGWRRGQRVPLKANADEALARVARGEARRRRPADEGDVPMTEGRDVTWTQLIEAQPSDPATCPCEPMDAEDLLYLLYTSGTTAKPKGIVHTTGGYLVGVATTHHYDLRPQARHATSTGARPTSAGSPATATSSTARSATAPRASSTRARPTSRTRDRWWDDRRALRRDDPLHRADGDPRAHEVGAGARGRSTTSRRCGCSARSASRSTPRRGCGTTSTSAASAARSSTRGGRRRRG